MRSYTRNQPFWDARLTTSPYTGAVQEDAVSLGPERAGEREPVRGAARSRLPGRLLKAVTSPSAVRIGLDLLALAFVIVAFTRPLISAEFMFHGVFVILVLHAFLFGLRGTLLRIGLASVPLLLYADGGALGLDLEPLELTEWPLMFVIAGLVAWMADRRASTSRRYATLFRRTSERLLTVEEDERRRIARELHDGVGQVLTALTLTLDAVAAEPQAPTVGERVGRARGLADTALAGTRDLSHRIRPTRLEERGLVAAVRDLAGQSGFGIELDADPACGAAATLGSTATVEIYRIAQEALVNAARHSGADRAAIAIRCDDGRLELVVSDAGRGFDPSVARESGIGLAGMEERARLLGAQLSIDAAPGAGTRVRVSIPLGAGSVAS